MCHRNKRYFGIIALFTVIFIFTIIFVDAVDPSNGNCEKVVYDLKNCACIKLLKEWIIKCDEDRKMCYDVFGPNLKENNSKTTIRFKTKMENILIEPNGRNMNNYSIGLFLISQEEYFKQIGNGYFLEDISWNNLLQNAFKNRNESSSTTSCYGQTTEIPSFKKQYPDLNCDKIVNGDGAYIREELAKNERRRETEPKMEAMDCQSIIERHNLDIFNSSDQYCEEERQFPIALVRTVFKDYQMLEDEFAISYAPQNFYCYAIDAKSPDLFHRQINELAQCFPNVFVLSKEKERKMDSSGLNQIYSAVECLKLISQPEYGWKYAIILQNHDVQLKTNQELVQIFKWMNGTNDIEYTPINVRKSFYDAGDWSLANLHLFKKESLNAQRDNAGQLLSLRYSKGYFQVSLSRAFVNWMLENLNLGPILEQLNTFYGNDEHFWGVLSANDFMEAPGGFTQKCFDQKILAPSFTRFSIWEPDNKLCQSGLWRNGICVLGLEDVAMLRKTPYLFANKMMPEMDAGAIECIHEMIYNRTHFERGFQRLCPIYYAELPQVRYNRDKLMDSKNFDVNKFNCCYKLLYSI